MMHANKNFYFLLFLLEGIKTEIDWARKKTRVTDIIERV